LDTVNISLIKVLKVMADVNFNELFGNFSAADALAATETKNTSTFSRDGLYKPSIRDEKCKDMNYRALVRFIPFFHDGKWRTTVSRWECFLKDVNGDNGIFVVSPKTNGQKCPMRSLSYKLYSSDSAIDKANSKKISVYQQYYAIIEVVKDVQHPEYDGKFFIYQFGQKINDKIEAAMKSTEFTDGFNPFALYDARLFEINLTKDATKKMDNDKAVTNYEACRFIEKTAPIHFGEGKTLEQGDRESQKGFIEWLEKDAPRIKDYFWKEWDSETTAKVNANLATYTSGYTAPRTPVAQAAEVVNTATSSPVESAPVSQSPSVNLNDMEDMPDFDNESGETTVSDGDDDWINSVLNG
jgi:hypothetical protein